MAVLPFFKINRLPIVHLRDLSKCHNLLYRICLIPDNNIADFGIKQVLEDTSLMTVFVIQCIALFFTDLQINETPYLQIICQPPVSLLLIGISKQLV